MINIIQKVAKIIMQDRYNLPKIKEINIKTIQRDNFSKDEVIISEKGRQAFCLKKIKQDIQKNQYITDKIIDNAASKIAKIFLKLH